MLSDTRVCTHTRCTPHAEGPRLAALKPPAGGLREREEGARAAGAALWRAGGAPRVRGGRRGPRARREVWDSEGKGEAACEIN